MGNHRRLSSYWKIGLVDIALRKDMYSFAKNYVDIWNYGYGPGYLKYWEGLVYDKLNTGDSTAINIIYCTPIRAEVLYNTFVLSGCPHAEMVEAFMLAKNPGMDMDDADLSPYAHTNDDGNVAARWKYLSVGEDAYGLRINSDDVLDFLFGSIQEGGVYNGTTSLNTPCWFKQKMTVMPNLKWMGIDNFYFTAFGSGYALEDATELLYTAANWKTTMKEFLRQFKIRIGTPFGIKVHANFGTLDSLDTLDDYIDYVDGFTLEYGLIGYGSPTTPNSITPYTAGGYVQRNVLGQIEIGKRMIAKGGILFFRQSYTNTAFNLVKNAGTYNVSITDDVITVGENSYNLKDYKVNALMAKIALDNTDLTCNKTTPLCIPYDADASCLAVLSSTAVPTTVYYKNFPRHCYLTAKAFDLLCGAGEHQSYGTISDTVAYWNDSDIFDWYDLLGDDDDTSDHVLGAADSKVHYRYRKKGVAVLNWSDSPVAVTPSSFGRTENFYPVSTNLIIPGVTAVSAASVTVPAHAGELIAWEWEL